MLTSAVGAVTLRLNALLQDRPHLMIGIARQQLVIEGVATDPSNPVLRELATRLHKQQLGAVKLAPGAADDEVADVLRTIGSDRGRGGEPLGTRPIEELQRWTHIRLFPQAYDQLELAASEAAVKTGDAGGGEGRAARLWVGLAAAALALESDQLSPTVDPEQVARAIDEHRRDVTYDKIIVGYLLQLGRELKMAQGSEAVALSSRLTGLLGGLKPETIRSLLDLGGDLAQRTELMREAAQVMPVNAVVELLRAAAGTQQNISHSLIRLLTKLAAQSQAGSLPIRNDADAALREIVRQLIEGWNLQDPNPQPYTKLLERLARPTPGPRPSDTPEESEAPRVVKMSLETGTYGETVWNAVDEMVGLGQASELVALLESADGQVSIQEAFWQHLATPGCVRLLLMNEPRDTEVVERVVARMGLSAAEPMLDALEVADSRATRRRLLTRLGNLGPAVGPYVVQRLPSSPWFVQRNMLALLGSMPVWPREFSPEQYAGHAEARVRREALKMLLRLPDRRDEAICAGLADPDEQIVRMALGAAVEACPPAAVPRVMGHLNARARDPELRMLGIRVLASLESPGVRDWLIEHAVTKQRWFRRRKLASKGPELLTVLSVLAKSWSRDPKAAEVLHLATSSGDSDIRTAATPPAPPA